MLIVSAIASIIILVIHDRTQQSRHFSRAAHLYVTYYLQKIKFMYYIQNRLLNINHMKFCAYAIHFLLYSCLTQKHLESFIYVY